jgi:hypothetical protein
MNIAFLFLGLVSGLFAGLLAFVITYDEYSRHYTDRRRTLRLALEAAAFAFFVFLALSVATGFVLTRAYMLTSASTTEAPGR